MRVFYYNGDVKETLQASGLVKYFYSQTGTWHLTYPDKREVLQFQNGQEEVRYPDGSLQISFADGSVKKISADGAEDMSFTDGTRVEVRPNGDRTLRLLNGQIEVHTAEYKVRGNAEKRLMQSNAKEQAPGCVNSPLSVLVGFRQGI